MWAPAGVPALHTISMMRSPIAPELDQWDESRDSFRMRFVDLDERITMSDMTGADAPVLDLLARMTADSLEASSLDPGTLVLVRVAALVAVGAPPVSYALNLEAGSAIGLDVENLRGVLTAIAPIVGTARIAAATGNIVKALAAEIALDDLEVADLDDDDQS
jgi:alkylhydroperoxidase/carboxymuconolactone decarboxylase family protein YurZ